MRKFVSVLSAAFVLTSLAVPCSAAVLDSFNRSNSADLGSNWTQINGSSGISGGEAYGQDLSLAIFNGASGSTVSFDISTNGISTQYIAAVIGYGAGTNYFVKVQNNGGSSLFTNFGFYEGNNGAGDFGVLSSSFASGHVVVSVQDTTATLTITPDVGSVQVYSRNYGPGFNGGNIGLGFYGAARADNFGNGDDVNVVPEPTSTALLGLGLLGFVGARRKSNKATNT